MPINRRFLSRAVAAGVLAASPLLALAPATSAFAAQQPPCTAAAPVITPEGFGTRIQLHVECEAEATVTVAVAVKLGGVTVASSETTATVDAEGAIDQNLFVPVASPAVCVNIGSGEMCVPS